MMISMYIVMEVLSSFIFAPPQVERTNITRKGIDAKDFPQANDGTDDRSHGEAHTSTGFRDQQHIAQFTELKLVKNIILETLPSSEIQMQLHVHTSTDIIVSKDRWKLANAVMNGEYIYVQQYIEAGFDVNVMFPVSPENVYYTCLNNGDILIEANALHLAVCKADEKMVVILLEAKCDRNMKICVKESSSVDKEDTTALHMAIAYGFDTIADLLVSCDKVCDINAKAMNGSRPVEMALINGMTSTACKLIEKQCDHDTHAHFGSVKHCSLLHLALYSRCDEAALMLINRGAIWDQKDGSGKTPVDVAKENRCQRVLDYLFKTFLESHNRITMKRVPKALTRTYNDYKRLRHVGKVKGLCFIINNHRFNDGNHRDGTLIDEEELRKTFTHFGYLVLVFRDLKQNHMEKVLELARDYNHSPFDNFFCIILTHGNPGILFGVDNKPMEMQTFSIYLQKTHCPSLAEKPKVLIVQACQGDKQGPLEQETNESKSSDVRPGLGTHEDTRWFPTEEDFIYYYSTMPGFVAYRNENGSYFIKHLVSRLNAIPYGERIKFSDIEEDVNRNMVNSPEVKKQGFRKQVPTYISTAGPMFLTKSFF